MANTKWGWYSKKLAARPNYPVHQYVCADGRKVDVIAVNDSAYKSPLSTDDSYCVGSVLEFVEPPLAEDTCEVLVAKDAYQALKRYIELENIKRKKP